MQPGVTTRAGDGPQTTGYCSNRAYRLIELLTLVADLFIHLVTSKTIFASQFASLEDGENRPRNDGIKEIHFFFHLAECIRGLCLEMERHPSEVLLPRLLGLPARS